MKLCVATGCGDTRLLKAFKPLLTAHDTIYAPLDEISAQKPEALLLCADMACAVKALPHLLKECAIVLYAPETPLWPVPVEQMLPRMEGPGGELRVILPELFLPSALSLQKALNSPFVGPVGTVNLLRTSPDTLAAQALLMQEVLPLVHLLGGAQSAFMQHRAEAGKEAAFLTLQMQSGALISLSAYTGAPGNAQRRYDYACRDGVVSYDSAKQPLYIHIGGQEAEGFPPEEREDAKALRLAWEAAVQDGKTQNRVFLESLHVAALMERAMETGRVAEKEVGV